MKPVADQVVLGGMRTRLLSWGGRDATAVVVAHSAGLDASSFESFAQSAVTRGHRVVAVDLRGHGESEAEPTTISLEAMAADLAELAGMLDRPRLLGISMGGVVAGMAVARDPSAWTDLTVVSSPDRGYRAFAERATAHDHGMAALIEPTLERWFTPEQRAENHPAVVAARRSLTAMRPESWDMTWRDFATFTGWPRLRRRIPTLCIAGELDASTPPAVMASIATTIGAELHVIAGATHQLLMTHAEEAVAFWA